MKNLLAPILAVFFSATTILAQDPASTKYSFDGFYNISHVGKSASFVFNRHYDQHTLSGGLKYHLNQVSEGKETYAFKHRFRQESPEEALGLNLGYSYTFLKYQDIAQFYANYLFQFSYLGLEYGTDRNTNLVMFGSRKPFYIAEHTLGVGLCVRIWKNLYLNQSAGIGMAHFIHRFDPHTNGQTDWAQMLRVGVRWEVR